MSDWSREAKIGFLGVIVAIIGIAAGILTYEIRRAIGLNPEVVSISQRPIPFTNGGMTPHPTPNINVATPKYPEQIEITNPLTIKRIKFARGGTSSVVIGTIRSASEHDFLLKARSQQMMTVSLSSGSAIFCVYAPDGSSLSETGNAEWSGVLPQSGDYRVKVLANGHDDQYRLEVSIR